jgi:hypothetical protein
MSTIFEVATRGGPFGLPRSEDYIHPMAWRWAPGAPNHDAALAPSAPVRAETLYEEIERLRVRYERQLLQKQLAITKLRRALRQYEPDHPLLDDPEETA